MEETTHNTQTCHNECILRVVSPHFYQMRSVTNSKRGMTCEDLRTFKIQLRPSLKGRRQWDAPHKGSYTPCRTIRRYFRISSASHSELTEKGKVVASKGGKAKNLLKQPTALWVNGSSGTYIEFCRPSANHSALTLEYAKAPFATGEIK